MRRKMSGETALAIVSRTSSGVGQMSEKGGPWKGDLSLTYTRVG